MKPRYAQERHTHEGGNPIGAGQRGAQIVVAGSGDHQWGSGLAHDRLVTQSVSSTAASIQPSLTSGLALDALWLGRSGKGSSSFSNPQALQSNGYGIGRQPGPALNDRDVRLRWRFGAKNWVMTAGRDRQWAAVIAEDYFGATSVSTDNANVSSPLWDVCPGLEFTVSGGVLVPTPLPDIGCGGWGAWGVTGNGRFVAVGMGQDKSGLVMVARPNAAGSMPGFVVDLGLSYESGDLVTWDLTCPKGADTVHMKVWRQRMLTDTPVSVEFDVPLAWMPWAATVCPPMPVAGPCLVAGWHNSVDGTWRQVIATLSLEADATGWGVSVDAGTALVVGYTGPPHYTPIYESGPYLAYQVYGWDTGGTPRGGYLFNGKYTAPNSGLWSSPTVSTVRFRVSTSATSTSPGVSGAPGWFTLGGPAQDGAVPTFAMTGDMDTTDGSYMYWAGLVLPRPTDDYALPGG